MEKASEPGHTSAGNFGHHLSQGGRSKLTLGARTVGGPEHAAAVTAAPKTVTVSINTLDPEALKTLPTVRPGDTLRLEIPRAVYLSMGEAVFPGAFQTAGYGNGRETWSVAAETSFAGSNPSRTGVVLSSSPMGSAAATVVPLEIKIPDTATGAGSLQFLVRNGSRYDGSERPYDNLGWKFPLHVNTDKPIDTARLQPAMYAIAQGVARFIGTGAGDSPKILEAIRNGTASFEQVANSLAVHDSRVNGDDLRAAFAVLMKQAPEGWNSGAMERRADTSLEAPVASQPNRLTGDVAPGAAAAVPQRNVYE